MEKKNVYLVGGLALIGVGVGTYFLLRKTTPLTAANATPAAMAAATPEARLAIAQQCSAAFLSMPDPDKSALYAAMTASSTKSDTDAVGAAADLHAYANQIRGKYPVAANCLDIVAEQRKSAAQNPDVQRCKAAMAAVPEPDHAAMMLIIKGALTKAMAGGNPGGGAADLTTYAGQIHGKYPAAADCLVLMAGELTHTPAA